MIVDLFAGSGGWDTGVRLAGYDGALVGIEHDMSACRTAVAAGHARICADVAAYPTAPFVGKVDGLIASPPCQAWSTAGDRKGEIDREAVYALITAYARGRQPIEHTWADERSQFTAEPMRWAAALRPRWIALEQVPPVLPLWEHMAALLRELDYRTWTGILSAEEYGVPQTRKRAILIARRDGLPVGPPVPTHQPYRTGRPAVTEPDLFGDPLPSPVSMADALGWGLPGQPSPVVMTARGRQSGPQDVLRGSAWRHEWFQRQMAEGNWVPLMAPAGKTSEMVEPRPVTDPAHTLTGKGTAAWVLRNGNQANACARARALDEPAGTLFFGQRTNAVDWQTDEGSLRVSVAEAGVLQSFPADYPWQGTKSAQYRQCGDAVPPLLSAAILRPLLADASGARGVAA